MGEYLNSISINSFPSTKRASVNKLMTENSVTRLINRLVNFDGFVITTGLKDVDFTQDIPVDVWNNNVADFEFIIRGYYFSISKENYQSGLANLMSQVGWDYDYNNSNMSEDQKIPQTLFARIIIDKTDENFPELYGQDSEDEEYHAIRFYKSSSGPNPIIYPSNDYDNPELVYDVYDFPVLKYMQTDSGNWGSYVPLDSLFRFSSISISNIDGGEVIL